MDAFGGLLGLLRLEPSTEVPLTVCFEHKEQEDVVLREESLDQGLFVLLLSFKGIETAD